MSAPRFEPVTGRYLHLDLLGKPHRLYVEEAGEGIPLLCLHTAGSDGRQFRAILNDPEIAARFRVIAFDLPWHGKSSPPAGWHEVLEYRLTSRDYTDIVLGVVQALGLDQPVAMGCSIGGRIVLHLALEHPDAFRAVIGLQAGAHVDPYYDTQWLHRPDVHGEVAAAIVSGLAPGRPALTWMVGKSTTGRSLTGSVRYAIAPNTMTPSMMSVVATGRLMKTAEGLIVVPPSRLCQVPS